MTRLLELLGLALPEWEGPTVCETAPETVVDRPLPPVAKTEDGEDEEGVATREEVEAVALAAAAAIKNEAASPLSAPDTPPLLENGRCPSADEDTPPTNGPASPEAAVSPPASKRLKTQPLLA